MPGPAFICVLKFGDIEIHRIKRHCVRFPESPGPAFIYNTTPQDQTELGTPRRLCANVLIETARSKTGSRPSVRLSEMPGPAFMCVPTFRQIQIIRIQTKRRAVGPRNAGPGAHWCRICRWGSRKCRAWRLFAYLDLKTSNSTGSRPSVGLPEMPGPAFVCMPAFPNI